MFKSVKPVVNLGTPGSMNYSLSQHIQTKFCKKCNIYKSNTRKTLRGELYVPTSAWVLSKPRLMQLIV